MTTDSGPGQAQQPQEIMCSKCGQYVDPSRPCPHCGTQEPKRMRIGVFCSAILFLAAMGLFATYLTTLRKVSAQPEMIPPETPVVSLGNIDTNLINQVLDVEGVIEVITPPRPGSKMPWALTIMDKTGSRKVAFWQSTYDEIKDKTRIAKGTRINARVSVSTYRDEIQLWLNAATDLQFQDFEPPVSSGAGMAPRNQKKKDIVGLNKITKSMTGQVVKVTGKVAAIQEPTPETKEPFTLTLEEGTNRITVVYWDNVARNLGGHKPFVGGILEVDGGVNLYQDKIQIKVLHSNQIKLINEMPSIEQVEPTGQVIDIGRIQATMKGKTVVVKGTLGEPQSIRSGVIFPISDKSGTIQMVLWDRSIPGPARDKLEAGIRVTVTGQVDKYNESLEIIPPTPESIVFQ